MFWRGLCARCYLHETYVASKSRLVLQFSRKASILLARTRPPAGTGLSAHSIEKIFRRRDQQSSEQATSPQNVSGPNTEAKGPGRHSGATQTKEQQTSSPSAGALFTPWKRLSLDEAEDMTVVFEVTEEAKLRVREASHYIQQNYERKQTRNSILKSPQSSEWQTDWRASFDMLRLEYALGRYVENAQAPSVQRKEHWPRWDRETSPLNVPEPPHLSANAVHKYVQRILSTQASPPLQKLLYNHGLHELPAARKDQVSQVSKKIESIFRDEVFRPFLTTEAFEDALRYMIRHNRLSTARQLLNLMIENKVPIRTSTFNLFFGSAAFHNDLRFFTYILKLKQSLVIPSDGHTWGAYLRTLLSRKVKLTVFWEMEKAGLFEDTTALRNCVVEIIEAELQKHATSVEPVLPVLERFDASFGHEWASVAVANKICVFLGSTGSVEQIPRVLAFMETRNCKPNSETLSALIHQASLMGKNNQVLGVIKLFQARYNLSPRAKDFYIMFKAAWETRSFNSCHVIWRLACGFGFVAPGMRNLVYQSLLRNTPQHPSTLEERWLKEAGKVIAFSRPQHQRMKELLGYEPNAAYVTGDVRIEDQALAANIIRCDRLTRLRGSFQGNWVPFYEAAVRRDQRWAENDVLSSKPLRWKLQKVIRFGKQRSPIQKRSETKFRRPFYKSFKRRFIVSGPPDPPSF